MNGGIASEETYPYTPSKDDCSPPAELVFNTDDKCGTTSANGPDAVQLKHAVYNVGPVTVAMDASYLHLYDAGIYTSKECKPGTEGLNHALLNVGYGSADGVDYWIVKNSWGSDWGEEGFFRIERGVDMCGIETDTQYPIVLEN